MPFLGKKAGIPQGRLDALGEFAARLDKDDEDLLDEIMRLANVDDDHRSVPGTDEIFFLTYIEK